MYRGPINRKSADQIEAMAAAGEIQARCLRMLRAKCRPGVTTAELDQAAERFIRSQGATPSFKGYRGFPGSICASPNSMVVHGIPGPYELRRGDLISLDVGVTFGGWVADAAITVPVGKPSKQAETLLTATREALFAGIEQARPQNRLGDVSAAVQARVEADGLSVIRSLVGHGIGREMHEEPQIPNFGEPGKGPVLEEGMALAIEPMVNAGGPEIRMGNDGWAVYSADDSRPRTSSSRSPSPRTALASSPPGICPSEGFAIRSRQAALARHQPRLRTAAAQPAGLLPLVDQFPAAHLGEAHRGVGADSLTSLAEADRLVGDQDRQHRGDRGQRDQGVDLRRQGDQRQDTRWRRPCGEGSGCRRCGSGSAMCPAR